MLSQQILSFLSYARREGVMAINGVRDWPATPICWNCLVPAPRLHPWATLQRLRDVPRGDRLGTRQIGDGAGECEQGAVEARAENCKRWAAARMRRLVLDASPAYVT